MAKRESIPKFQKELIRFRQKNKCACCIEKGEQFHHFNPVALGGKNDSNNIILLCKRHHKLLHLADIETITQIYEYVYYLIHNELPINPYDINSLLIIKKDSEEKMK